MIEVATLGAGCFWCIEAVFLQIEGVISVKSGYTGGQIKNPCYREICTGETGHAEVAQIQFDSSKISFEEILEIFWTTHDPTTLNRQGNDRGTQYRSAIFYHSEGQQMIAQKSKQEFASTLYDDPIVTEIVALDIFYPAEDNHHNYYELNPQNPYCQVVINPKIRKVREKFANKLKSNII